MRNVIWLVTLGAFLLLGCPGGGDPACGEQKPCPEGFTCSNGLCLEQPADAGQQGLDASETSPDAGTAAVDAGQNLPDAADSTPDAGPVSDAGSAGPDASAGADAALDPCVGVTCSGHGTCLVDQGAAKCACETDFQPAGLECVPTFPAPTATFSAPVAPPTVQQEAAFDAAASTGTGLSYRWDFEADGTFDTAWATSATAKRRFCAPATYTVKLEVRDAAGRTAQATRPLTVTWFGQAAWVGISNDVDGDYSWWTVLGLDGSKTSDTRLKIDGSSTYTRARFARQASDGRVLGTLQCAAASVLCDHNEVVILGRGGQTGVFTTAASSFLPHELVELPDGTWLVGDRTSGDVVHADAQGLQLGVWATRLAGPSGMELSSDGASVLVALNTGGRIQRYSLSGADLGRWDELGKVSAPYQIRRLSTGRYLVSDLAGKVVEFEADGRFSATVLGPSQVTVPTGLAELPDGRILVGETCTSALDSCGSVKVLDRTTGSLSVWAPTGTGWVLWNPESINIVYE